MRMMFHSLSIVDSDSQKSENLTPFAPVRPSTLDFSLSSSVALLVGTIDHFSVDSLPLALSPAAVGSAGTCGTRLRLRPSLGGGSPRLLVHRFRKLMGGLCQVIDSCRDLGGIAVLN